MHELKHVLQGIVLDEIRVRIYFGEPETGVDDCQDSQTKGYIRVQYGKLALFPAANSKVGIPLRAFPDPFRIVKITGTANKAVLYQHPSYDCGEWQIGKLPNGRYTAERNGLPHATFTYQEQALGYVKFITGEHDNADPIRITQYDPCALAKALKGKR